MPNEPVPVLKQQRQVVGHAVGDGQVQFAVAVEVAQHHRLRAFARGKRRGLQFIADRRGLSRAGGLQQSDHIRAAGQARELIQTRLVDTRCRQIVCAGLRSRLAVIARAVVVQSR